VEFETLLGLFINLHMDQSSSVLFWSRPSLWMFAWAD